MKFPIINNKMMTSPMKSQCPHCKKKTDSSFAILSGGAMLMNKQKTSGSMDERMKGFLHIAWHGDHSGNSKNPYADIQENIDIVEDATMGQFEFYFCSTECLRNFLNKIVDALESKISKHKK